MMIYISKERSNLISSSSNTNLNLKLQLDNFTVFLRENLEGFDLILEDEETNSFKNYFSFADFKNNQSFDNSSDSSKKNNKFNFIYEPIDHEELSNFN